MSCRGLVLLASLASVALLGPTPLVAQRPAPAAPRLPALPDSSGWGVHVLTAAQDSQGGVWVGTYGHGIFHLAPGATTWARIHSDTTDTSLSWDFVDAFGFGPRGEVWYGTVGNGWGLSTDGGRTWRNWTLRQLGPEWQYVAPQGIVTLGDTTVIGTADGLQITSDDGAHWTAIGDTTGPRATGPADTALALLPNEYVLRVVGAGGRLVAQTLRGPISLEAAGRRWAAAPSAMPLAQVPTDTVRLRGRDYRPTHCGLIPADSAWRGCFADVRAPAAAAPARPRTTWFARPIAREDNAYIDQTYRYGSTMGGNFQQHQGVEFNNPDGTPVHAIGAGTVVYAGRAEAGALTVAIRHDTTVAAPAGAPGLGGRLHVYSVYYHNSALAVRVGDRVTPGQVISRVGNTGRATNDHLHLEVHAAPTDSIGAIVDSLDKFPPYTTNPELWIAPLPGTGIVAGRVFGPDGKPVPQARIYGIVKPRPAETPFSFAETYGDRAHPHPLYHEHFAVGDVPAGSYVLGVQIGDRKVYRRVRVEPGKVTWVEFR
ncbi:MAG TPA: M23 family metallopeptidase [Gemmatimonadales bacterium]|nr:M23 family metallopeptidase [Gemmatimonadales bacterium]